MARIIVSNEKEKEVDEKSEDILFNLRENFNLASNVYSKQREEAREDFKFRSGDQWPEEIKNQREKQNRPCLKVNKINQYIRQVVNSQKINRPSINVNPGDSTATKEVAKVFQAIIKNTELKSMADNAYDTAFDCACTGGEGYFRIVTEYEDMGFDQDISIKAIDNPFSVYIDPSFKSDFSNINWAIIYDDISKDEFKRLYPDSDACSDNFFVNNSDWVREDTVRIAEYFYIEYEDVPLVLLKNGEKMTKEEYESLPEETKAKTKIIKERTGQKKIVKWIKTNGHEILEETVFPGSYIPIVPVFADTYLVDGKRVFEGVVRQAKDPQRMINYMHSAKVEQIALSPKAPFIGIEGQFEGHEAAWANANISNVPYLEYKAVGSGGVQAPPPQRSQFDPKIDTIIQAEMTSNEDLKATTGIYDPMMGSDKKEASGRALITKQRQNEVTNFMYVDNLSKSLKYAGKILLDIIPHIYDTERVVRILGGVNEEDQIITINSSLEKNPIFLEVGKYDIDVSIGPYGENQRQDSIDSMLALMQINPQLSEIMGDIFVGKQDWPGAKEISERLKIMLPPALQKDNKELPPEVQGQIAQAQQQYETKIAQDAQQMQAMQELIANTTSELNKVKADLNNKQADIESKERIAAMQARVQLAIAGMKEDSTDNRLAFQQELSFTQQKQQAEVNSIPKQADEYVLSGVNDPVTEANSESHGELTPEEMADLLKKINNHTPQTTQM